MAYRFKLNERAGNALLRSGAEQFQHALESLRNADTIAGIHGTRKCIKRLRALLRLARPGLDKADYVGINTTLGDAGRTLSATRDRDVLRATVAHVAAGSPHLRLALRHVSSTIEPTGETHDDTPHAAVIRKARDLLKTAATDWKALELSSDDFSPLAEGLERGMRDLARAFEATAGGDEEAFHDLRKTVQRHWRHMRLVEAGWPAYFGARAEEAKAIAELLGKAQDLTLLLRHLRKAAKSSSPGSEDANVRDTVEKQRTALHEAARSRTRRLLAEGPRAHARRAAEYWTAARALHEAETPPSPEASPEIVAEKTAEATLRTATRSPPRKRSPAAKPSGRKRSSKKFASRRKPAQ